MGNPNRTYPVAFRGGPWLRIDSGNFPGNPGQEFLDPWVADVSKTRALPLQENTGALIETYRTGRPMQLFQDISSLTAQMPIEQVYQNRVSYLQPVEAVYLNILSSPALGGKAG